MGLLTATSSWKAGGFSSFVTIHLTVSNHDKLFPALKPFLYYLSQCKFLMECRVVIVSWQCIIFIFILIFILYILYRI